MICRKPQESGKVLVRNVLSIHTNHTHKTIHNWNPEKINMFQNKNALASATWIWKNAFFNLSYHYFMVQTSKKVPEVIMSSESKLCCCSAGQWEVQATRNHAISGLWLNNNVQWTLSTKYFVNYSDRRRGYNTGMATDAHLDSCHRTTTTDDRSSSDGSDIYDVFGL